MPLERDQAAKPEIKLEITHRATVDAETAGQRIRQLQDLIENNSEFQWLKGAVEVSITGALDGAANLVGDRLPGVSSERTSIDSEWDFSKYSR